MSWTQQVVTVNGPTLDEAKALLSQLKLQTVTHSTKVSEQINEEELLWRLLNCFTNLIVAIFLSFLNIILLIISL